MGYVFLFILIVVINIILISLLNFPIVILLNISLIITILLAIHGKIRKKEIQIKKIKKKRNHWQSDEEHIEQLEIAKKILLKPIYLITRKY